MTLTNDSCNKRIPQFFTSVMIISIPRGNGQFSFYTLLPLAGGYAFGCVYLSDWLFVGLSVGDKSKKYSNLDHFSTNISHNQMH